MIKFNYNDILNGVKNIFLNQRDGYDCEVNDEAILSVDWDEENGDYRNNAYVSLIIKRNRVKVFRLVDYLNEDELAKDIFDVCQKNCELEDYINTRIKQEQEESSEWIDRILNAESEEAERVLKEYNQKKFGL